VRHVRVAAQAVVLAESLVAGRSHRYCLVAARGSFENGGPIIRYSLRILLAFSFSAIRVPRSRAF